MASEAALQTMDMCFEFESNFMAADGFYSDPDNLIIRKLAISIIATHWKTDIDAFVPYLAMNYFDRFVSQSEKQYSLETDINEDFYSDKINGIMYQIWDGLNGEKLSVTPFSFVDHYYYPTFANIGGFKRRCINEIIVQAQGEDYFIKYKPSEIALSSFLAACHFSDIDIPDELEIVKEKLVHCVLKLVDLCIKKNIKIETDYPSSATLEIPQGNPGQQIPAMHNQMIADIELSESEKKRRAKGKAVMVGPEPIIESVNEETNKGLFTSEAPKTQVNFYLLWPTSVDPI
ncbi:hypothetical protein RIF29_39259 [Crotalaria pallida]|uniref:Uncharacterized protein n=1 Tax=Crotalaria pallida TaxID=3830 RepID=A0AAN9E3B4_CROPI